jgi:hypothetical protein
VARRRPRRRGILLSAEMVIIMPLIIGIALAIVQFILIATANFRVDVAAAEAAAVAAKGGNKQKVFEAAGLALGYLSSDYQVEFEYFDKRAKTNDSSDGKVGEADPGKDFVTVSVRIPMENASHNWLGFLGGSVKNLHLRAVITRTITSDAPFPIPVN